MVRPDEDNDRIGNFLVDTSFMTFAHTTVIGTVVAVPDNLLYYGREAHAIRAKGRIRSEKDQNDLGYYNQYSTAYDVPVEVSVGDRVIFKSLAVDNSPIKGDVVTLLYDTLILKFWEGGIYPLNGHVLVEPVEEDGFQGEGEVKGRGTVAALGCLVRGYRDFHGKDFDLYKVGDKVLYMNSYNIPVENEMYRTLDKRYFYMHRRNILCVQHRS